MHEFVGIYSAELASKGRHVERPILAIFVNICCGKVFPIHVPDHRLGGRLELEVGGTKCYPNIPLAFWCLHDKTSMNVMETQRLPESQIPDIEPQ